MRRIALTLGIGAVLLLAIAYLTGGASAALSSQVGYWSSVLVVAASMGSYRRMVRQRLEAGMVGVEERDPLEKIDDPHGLYEEEEPAVPETPREMVREEKARLKKQRRSPLQVGRDAVPAFSFWRLGAYGILVLGFFILLGLGMMNLAAYLPALALPIVLVVWQLVTTGGRDA
ncbi:hypothetical protein [Nitratifractor sp.]